MINIMAKLKFQGQNFHGWNRSRKVETLRSKFPSQNKNNKVEMLRSKIPITKIEAINMGYSNNLSYFDKLKKMHISSLVSCIPSS